MEEREGLCLIIKLIKLASQRELWKQAVTQQQHKLEVMWMGCETDQTLSHENDPEMKQKPTHECFLLGATNTRPKVQQWSEDVRLRALMEHLIFIRRDRKTAACSAGRFSSCVPHFKANYDWPEITIPRFKSVGICFPRYTMYLYWHWLKTNNIGHTWWWQVYLA